MEAQEPVTPAEPAEPTSLTGTGASAALPPPDPAVGERAEPPPGSGSGDGGTARRAALARAVTDIEVHVAAQGWDAPVRVFSLVRTAEALALDPGLADLLDPQDVTRARHDLEQLTVIEQEDLPAAADLEDLLGQLAWPGSVHGAALSVERVVLAPGAQAQAEAISDPQERMAFTESLAEREDIRVVAGVLRSGESWCTLRSRSHDSAAAVYQGERLVPGLVDALASTFL